MTARAEGLRSSGPAGGSRPAGGFAALGLLFLLSACSSHAPTWSGASELAATGASNPTLALDGRTGTSFVAWVGGGHHGADVWLRAVDPAGSVGEPVRVNDIAGDAAPHLQAPAQVAVGPEGDVYVVWVNNKPVEGRRFPSSDLRFARSTDGGATFEPALTVNDDADGAPASHTFHDIVVTADGTIVVSWLDSRREWNPEGVTGATAHIGPSFDPSRGGPDVRIAISRDGGRSFEPSHIVDQQTCPCCRTAMAAGPDGTLYLAWRKIFEGDVRDIVVAASRDGGATFEAPRRVADDDWVFPGCPHAGPALTVDEAGTVHVAWYTGQEDGPGLYYTSSTDGARTFADPTPLLSDGWVPPSQVTLAADGRGGLLVAWEDLRSETPSFYHLAVAAGDAIRPGEGVREEGSSPVLAVSAGRAGLAWLDGESVHFRGAGLR